MSAIKSSDLPSQFSWAMSTIDTCRVKGSSTAPQESDGEQLERLTEEKIVIQEMVTGGNALPIDRFSSSIPASDEELRLTGTTNPSSELPVNRGNGSSVLSSVGGSCALYSASSMLLPPSGAAVTKNSLADVIQNIQKDSQEGKGPGEYVLPGVQTMEIIDVYTGNKMLQVDSKPVDFIYDFFGDGAGATTKALGEMVRGNPTDIRVKGTYKYNHFFINELEIDGSKPSPGLSTVIAQIKKDAGKGSGPAEYVLPGVRHIQVARGYQNIRTLMVNAESVDHMYDFYGDGAEATAEALAEMVQGNPTDIRVKGSYKNQHFFIDKMEIVGDRTSARLSTIIETIKEDARKGNGPGRYILPDIRNLQIAMGYPNMAELMANAELVDYIFDFYGKGATVELEKLRETVKGNPSDIAISGSYRNGHFFIDHLESLDKNSLDRLLDPQMREVDRERRETKSGNSIYRGEDYVTIGGVKLECGKEA